jgi:hypothetical protein
VQDKYKSIIVSVSALGLAFMVMVAALMYDPNKDAGQGAEVIMVQGMVTDENGEPIEGAIIVADTYPDRRYDIGVQCITETDANGYYVMTSQRGEELQMFADVDDGADNTYWTECHEYDISDDPENIVSNFTLQHTENITIPLGIAIASDLIDDLTEINVTVDAQLLDVLIELEGVNTTIDRANVVFDRSIEISGLSGGAMLYMNASVCGTYDEAGRITYLYFAQTGEVRAVPFDTSVLADQAPAEDVVFNLSPGEVRTLTAVKGGVEYSLPTSLDRSFSFEVLGKVVAAHLTGIAYTYGTNDSSVTMTIEPHLEGEHAYYACVIGGCVVYLRELER